ncbi:MAG: hypothetical protein JWM31_2796, partial [Solirubrobacterales bacterium]|nr:hypothetical protein [Solirubrobacterales bacterium]
MPGVVDFALPALMPTSGFDGAGAARS